MTKTASWLTATILGFGLLLGGSVLPSLATGVFGGDAPSRIPTPARSFAVTVEDVGGTVVEISGQATFNGEVFLYGRFGAGQVTVPFERIRELRIEKTDDPLKRMAVVTLVDDTAPVRVELEDDSPWYGRTRFGNYKIEVKDLRAMRKFRLLPTE